MININQQEELFISLGNVLEKRIVVFAIGGTAMMLRGLKETTLDIDLVFEKKNERDNFIDALKKLGAKDFDVSIVYGLRTNVPIMLELGGVRFDLFLNKIITSTFSDKMKERSKEIHQFGKNLIIKIADVHDLILMKCVTSRIKDLEDIISIISKEKINWELIIEESIQQVKLGNEVAIVAIGEKLEKLNNLNPTYVPKYVFDKLWKILKEQVNKKAI